MTGMFQISASIVRNLRLIIIYVCNYHEYGIIKPLNKIVKIVLFVKSLNSNNNTVANFFERIHLDIFRFLHPMQNYFFTTQFSVNHSFSVALSVRRARTLLCVRC